MKTRAWSKSYVPTVILSLLFLFITACGSSSGGGDEPAVQSVAVQTLWYVDNDEDGFGSNTDPGASEEPASSEIKYVTNNLDCNDDDPEINPQALEQDDGIDHDCNGDPKPLVTRGYIPDTGQTKSYTDTFGEDSDFLISPQSYTKLDDNSVPLPEHAATWTMVKDEVTGLTWEVKQNADGKANPTDLHDSDNTCTWNEAKETYIAGLNRNKFGGFDDWRLPTITELLFLSKSQEETLCIDTRYYNHTLRQNIWSESENSQQANSIWTFDPSTGLSSPFDTNQAAVVWAVRGESKTSSFVDRGLGVIEDTTNGLMWQQVTGKIDESEVFFWTDALQYCNELNLSGYTDWRLPNKHELVSLIDHTKKDPAIQSDLFPDTETSAYWTSTRYDTKDVILTDFKYGQLFIARTYYSGRVRAVRGGHNVKMHTWYLDYDNDGYGDSTIFKEADSTRQPKGYVLNGDDCKDNDDTIHPGAVDIPDDGIDQDCNGEFMVTWYRDGDKDGFGTPNDTQIAEVQPTGYVTNNEDCNDVHIAINPDMTDLPDDGIDNNCNGMQMRSLYSDADLDGFGDKLGDVVGPPVEIANPEAGFSVNNIDCMDNDTTTNPSQVEIYGDSEDNNCNGEVDELPSQVIPDTGQTQSYTSITGEDSDISINTPSFTQLEGAVQDNVTGLIWELKTTVTGPQTVLFADAEAHCNELSATNLAGFNSGWRLPTVKELAFISNADQYSPAIDQGVFPNTQPYRYWTSTPISSSEPNSYLTIDFKNGTSKREENVQCHVRAVHDGPIVQEDPFEAPVNGTVKEKATGLTWQTTPQPADTYANALSFCDGLVLGGMSDWRLPSEADLKGLLSYSDEERTTVFGPSTADHWTSALSPVNALYAMTVILTTSAIPTPDINTSKTSTRNINTTTPFIAVRGQSTPRFIDNSNGTVTDLRTGLMWQKAAAEEGADFTWTGALTHCSSMALAGHNDWRLPSKNELLSLLDDSQTELQSAGDVLTGMEDAYWTSTASCDPSAPDSAWEINFSEMQEKVAIRDRTNTLRIRAVRGGKIETP
ncbi:hypothetical protein DSLASN_11840 [Desulfoluna limicola]|uniref:Lcl C-terminal domain-containing protein n=1 Tax=Desulfoluna limicola TaxID=2810562 RepID=A0ABN6F265_9BACT|nr:DUF1566 domain-containing protein [Desulfoluna limicola]BCS95552.1 hypothetical protein DSLASN_11840 [Desulfoluna limicola]